MYRFHLFLFIFSTIVVGNEIEGQSVFWDNSDMILNDVRHQLNSMDVQTGGGAEFLPGYTITLDEFIRPEDRTKLLFWREAGKL